VALFLIPFPSSSISSCSSCSSSSSALQLFVSFGLLNYFFPFFLSCFVSFPIIHSHLPQVIPHIVLPSYSWPSLRSCCIRFPFYMVLATLSMVILSTCPNQPSHLYFIYLTIFSLLIASSNSSFVLSLHSPFVFHILHIMLQGPTHPEMKLSTAKSGEASRCNRV